MSLQRFLFPWLVAWLLVGWQSSVPSALAQGKGGPEPKEPKEEEYIAPERLGKLTLALDTRWHAGEIRKVFFTPDGKQLITITDDHAIRYWDTASGEMNSILFPPGEGIIADADLSGDGKRLALASRYFEGNKLSHVIYVLSLPEGRVERVLRGSAVVRSVALSRDGKVLASSGWDELRDKGEVAKMMKDGTRVWNLDKEDAGKVISKAGYHSLALSPDGTRLACVGTQSAKDKHIGKIFDLASGKELATIKGDRMVVWSPDGKTVAAADSLKVAGFGQSIYVMDADGKEIRVLPVTRAIGKSIAFSPDSRTLLSASALFDVATGEELDKSFSKARHFSFDSGFGSLYALSPTNPLAVTAGRSVIAWSTRDGTVHKKMALPIPKWIPVLNHVAAWSADGLAVSWNTSPTQPSFHLGDLRLSPALNDARGAILKQDPWTIELLKGSKVRVLMDGKPAGPIKYSGGGTIVGTLFGKDQVAFGDSFFGHLNLFDARTGNEVSRFSGSQAGINSIAPSPDGRFLLTTSDKGQLLKIWNGQLDKPLLTLFCHGSDWIIWTPEGYYAATPGGERIMGWVVDNGIDKMATHYPAERFRKQMYRPDVIKLLLAKGNLKDALATANADLKEPGVKVADGVIDLNKLLPPQATLQLLDTKDLPRVKVKARAVAAVKEQPVTALRLLVDGRPIADGAAYTNFEQGKDKAEAEWNVTLPPGKHQLTVLARCPDSSSKSNTVEITVADPAKQNTLHVLAVGVNDYEDSTLKLEFAAKDAQDIAANFPKCCKGELFHEVHSEALVNGKARKDVILSRLSALRKQAKPNDLVVIFFAGHGVKEKEKFYLLPVEAKTTDLAKTAISGDELRKSLGEFPCQVLLMLDACHSSAGLKNFRPAVDDITRNLTDDDCGVAVLCAAMAHEKALEKEGNGLFTRAIVDGLNRGDGVPFNTFDRMMYIHHLHSYVFDRVSHQSGGRQHPFLSLPWVVESFPVARFAAK